MVGEAAGHRLRRGSSRGCGCRAAAARRRRAWRGGAAPRTRPAARPWRARARARRRWPRSASPAAGRAPRSARLRARSWRAYGRCSSTYRLSGPNASSSRRATGSSSCPRPIAERAAQPVRQTSPSACVEHRLQLHRRLAALASRRAESRVWAWASVMIRQRLLQPRSSRTSSVMWRCGTRGPRRRPPRDRPRRRGSPARRSSAALWASSIEPETRVVVGQRERRVAELAGALRQLLRQRDAVQERVGRVAVQLDVGRRPDIALTGPGRTSRPSSRSWKTTMLRPRSPTSSQ